MQEGGRGEPEAEHRVAALDGWRGLAIIGVLVDHFVTAQVINLGRFGVELFFVLSGRLMADILFVRRTPLRVFFPRRFSRVYPALFCFVVLMAVADALWHPFGLSLPVCLAGLLFTMNYTAIFWSVSPAIDHLWSLAIEEHCYILLGLLAALSRWRPGLPVGRIILALVVLAATNGAIQTFALGRHYHNVYWRTDVRGASILISVGVQMWWRRFPAPPPALAGPAVPLLFFAAGLLLNLNAVPDPIKYTLGTLCLALALTTLRQAPAPAMRVLEDPVLTLLGIGSFSLYLWQQPFSLIPSPSLRYGSFVVIAIIAAISYRGIEQPARRWLNLWLTPHLHPSRPATPVSKPVGSVPS